MSALHSAIRWNKPPAEIEGLIAEHGVNDIDEKTGNYPIHIAAQNGHTKLMKLLLVYKAEVNAHNDKGNTPLHMAVAYDFDATEKALLVYGANPDITNKEGHPARLGIDGDLVQRQAVSNFQEAMTAADLIAALKTIGSTPDIDKVKIVKAGMAKKKEEGVEWTPDVQTLFTETIQAL
jgi:ankyrin repeat protein|mmetsp:Transcript_77436/g.129952  ORF Transcript_77436/g.129952 Transcript_77436/m.129952 type:complete len:178 (+) Transcript_77436:47-580(+)|eukprot:CAMPEP_0174295030 /NCGR_PEP_ID=MMETSP0809-20121228/43457_1 /TAXON_ID=73025 ORGANISM="Eutreptiella gymnastica-like, Strain CCMP1594" /NCGR_SAMPLE_ID=MMETSP0809 /ASSEMBLY_ACC=CAM_ASM_000658 /LENGTH=177 /DNA_ID=CAMNT_0015396957 /DNA_START=40 /DNA_END=573 /DNA_ORIENTATION=+